MTRKKSEETKSNCYDKRIKLYFGVKSTLYLQASYQVMYPPPPPPMEAGSWVYVFCLLCEGCTRKTYAKNLLSIKSDDLNYHRPTALPRDFSAVTPTCSAPFWKFEGCPCIWVLDLKGKHTELNFQPRRESTRSR